MTPILPFPAYLIRPEWADRVVSPMHDVLGRDERARLMVSNPYSYLNVSRQADDEEPGGHPGEQAAAALARLLAAGAFDHHPVPALYLYRLRSAGHQQTGVVAELPVEAFIDGRVRGHEAVQSERVEALVEHHRAVAGRSALVALMYRADPAVARLHEETCAEEPLLSMTGGLDQEVWRVGHPRVMAAFAQRVGDRVLYVTDGHHRVAAAWEEWRQAGKPEGRRVLCVLFPDDHLRTYAFYRRLVGPVPADALGRLEEGLVVEGAGGPEPAPGSFGIYLGGRWWKLTPRHPNRPPGVDGLDVARLHREILEPIFGVGNVGDPHLEVMPELTPIGELVGRCDADGGALFVLCAPTLAEVMEVADRGELMTAKSTYFDPKPRAGVFIRFPGE